MLSHLNIFVITLIFAVSAYGGHGFSALAPGESITKGAFNGHGPVEITSDSGDVITLGREEFLRRIARRAANHMIKPSNGTVGNRALEVVTVFNAVSTVTVNFNSGTDDGVTGFIPIPMHIILARQLEEIISFYGHKALTAIRLDGEAFKELVLDLYEANNGDVSDAICKAILKSATSREEFLHDTYALLVLSLRYSNRIEWNNPVVQAMRDVYGYFGFRTTLEMLGEMHALRYISGSALYPDSINSPNRVERVRYARDFVLKSLEDGGLPRAPRAAALCLVDAGFSKKTRTLPNTSVPK